MRWEGVWEGGVGGCGDCGVDGVVSGRLGAGFAYLKRLFGGV